MITFGIYRDRGPVTHPINPNKPIGWVSEVVGEVEITSTGHELATAIILDSYQEIDRGDKICPSCRDDANWSRLKLIEC